MKLLGIDTSTKILSVAVLDGTEVVAEYNVNLERQISNLLIPTIKEMLKRINITLGSIDAFAVSLGPGSFTGLRIGVSAVKGLSLATSKPIIGIPTLDIIASNVSAGNYQVCPVVDAKQGKVYTCYYRILNNKLKRLCSYSLIDVDSLLSKIKKPTIFLGDAIDLYEKTIKKRIGRLALFSDRNLWYPKASNLVMLAKDRYNRLSRVDPRKIVPLYLYPKECQIRLKKKNE